MKKSNISIIDITEILREFNLNYRRANKTYLKEGEPATIWLKEQCKNLDINVEFIEKFNYYTYKLQYFAKCTEEDLNLLLLTQ